MYSEPESQEAMKQEVRRFYDHDVVKIIPIPPRAKLLPTRWVVTDKVKDGKTIRSARCCIRGDLEQNKTELITEAPTVAKPILRLTLAWAAANRDWHFSVQDVSRAFLQTEPVDRVVLVQPPKEANVEKGFCWQLIRPVYGLDDAAHGFFKKNSNSHAATGSEMCSMDPATWFYFADRSTPLSYTRDLKGISATHVDDTVAVGNSEFVNEVIAPMDAMLVYGTRETFPTTFLGLQITRSPDAIHMSQDKYVASIVNLDKTLVTRYQSDVVLPGHLQAMMKSKLCQIQQISVTSRPDLAYDCKMLGKRLGYATKLDYHRVYKLVQRLKEETTKMTFPNLDNWYDWMLFAYSDASCKKEPDSIDSCGAGAIILANKKTKKGFPICWRSGVLKRIANSSMNAETQAAVDMTKDVCYVRAILEQMLGKKARDIPCILLIDCMDLFKSIHGLKPVSCKRMMTDIAELKQTYAQGDLIHEIRLVPAEFMLADGLSKPAAKSDSLLNTLQTGKFEPYGGWEVVPQKTAFEKLWVSLPADKRSAALSAGSAHITTTQPPHLDQAFLEDKDKSQ